MRDCPDRQQVAGGMHQAFRDEKTCRKLLIFPGSSHHDGNALALNPDFQRFLGSDQIFIPVLGGCVHSPHLNFPDLATTPR